MPRRALAVFALLACLAGCTKSGSDKVQLVRADDAKMNAAIEKARQTLPQFQAALKAPKQGQEDFAVKKGFVEAGQTEHMWVGRVTFDGTRFHGTLNNKPEMIRGVRMGQRVSVDPAQVSDWMYVDNGKLIGGYTIRVLRDGLSKRDRAEFDKGVPFTFE